MKILRIQDVVAKTGLAKSTVLRCVQRGAFPKQIYLGPRLIGWREADILTWMSAQAGGRPVAPDDRILRISEVVKMTGIPESTMYARIKDGAFPKQISLGSRAAGWLESDILAWIEARDNGPVSRDTEPAGPITARELFARAMRIMGQRGDPSAMARLCQIDPDALVQSGNPAAP